MWYLSETKASLKLKILMASWSKKGTQIYFSLHSKVPENEPPLQVPQQGPYTEGGSLQGVLHISQKPQLSGSPVKEPYLKVPFMESLAKKCPTTRDAPPLDMPHH